jgi:chemotaxis family two-component system response regulator Rcp1
VVSRSQVCLYRDNHETCFSALFIGSRRFQSLNNTPTPMSNEEAKQPTILLVEDNPIDVLMIKRALKNGGFQKQPIVLDDGGPAIEFLGRCGEFVAATLPDLVILDLNLRCVDGPEVLSFIRANPELLALRVIVLSSSPQEVMKTSAAKADCYFEKPIDVASFQKLGESIGNFYWNRRSAKDSLSSEASAG